MAIPHLFIRCIHTGVFQDGRANTGPVFLSDLDTGQENQNRKVACYVPAGGSIDIAATSRTLLSFDAGAIRKFTTAGLITSSMFMQPEVWDNGSRPEAMFYPAGVSIWNTDDKTLNWSDGTNWYGPDGIIT